MLPYDRLSTFPGCTLPRPLNTGDMHQHLHFLCACTWDVSVEPNIQDKKYNIIGLLTQEVFYISNKGCLPKLISLDRTVSSVFLRGTHWFYFTCGIKFYSAVRWVVVLFLFWNAFPFNFTMLSLLHFCSCRNSYIIYGFLSSSRKFSLFCHFRTTLFLKRVYVYIKI